MDNLRRALTMFFKRISSKTILMNQDKLYYDNINKNTFLRLSRAYLKEYSNDEARNLYDFLISEFNNQNERMNFNIAPERESINVFDSLFVFAEKVLLESQNYPVCRYEHLLRWRMASYELDEDLFTTAFLAYKDTFFQHTKRDFCWNPVIPHNNFRLNAILKKGIAENHFHLYGSVPHFPIIWVSLMNNIDNTDTAKTFEKYDRNRLSSNIHFSVEDGENPLTAQYGQAVIIRLFLYSELKKIPIIFSNKAIPYSEINIYINYNELKTVEGISKNCLVRDCILGKELISNLKILNTYAKRISEILFSELKYTNDFFDNSEEMTFVDFFDKSLEKLGSISIETARDIFDEKIFKKILSRENYKFIISLLNDNNLMKLSKNRIQDIINSLKSQQYFNAGKMPIDYIFCDTPEEKKTNKINASERWFMYEMFSKIYSKVGDYSEYYNLFYAYIVIKENIRAELIQINDTIGFDNFANYQDRKKDFIRGTTLENVLPRIAVGETILNQNICKLEARIGPENSAKEWYKTIKELDESILSANKDLIDKYYYVVHFIKNPEPNKDSPNSYRHRNKREDIKVQSEALADFRNRYPQIAKRIYGIDACNREIGCRPEVFAQAYRYLRNLSVDNNLPNLRATYHVGEDFLDILDGIRAIDEAMFHCNMRCGDRLGHAIALGIDVKAWYKSKNNKILIPQQDYLDNIVWLYSKIAKYKLAKNQNILPLLEREFELYFYKIYRANMDLEEYSQFLKYKKVQQAISPLSFKFDIPTYYASMKLRGDDPFCYINGYFENHTTVTTWNRYAINQEYPSNYQLRHNSEIAYLYHTYHYNTKVKQEGDKSIEVKISDAVINAVENVQKSLQHTVLQRGLAIETNPSSNYVISNFRRYDNHPIVSFFDKELSNTSDDNCCQIPVSINTDDQGVFATYITNEYALMALGLEKAKDKNGNLIYNKTSVYNWIDKIRIMGINQSFM